MMSAARDAVPVGVEHNFFTAVELLLAKKRLVVGRRQRKGEGGSEDVNFALLQTLFERSGRKRARCFCVWDAGFHSVHLLLVDQKRQNREGPTRKARANSQGHDRPRFARRAPM